MVDLNYPHMEACPLSKEDRETHNGQADLHLHLGMEEQVLVRIRVTTEIRVTEDI